MGALCPGYGLADQDQGFQEKRLLVPRNQQEMVRLVQEAPGCGSSHMLGALCPDYSLADQDRGFQETHLLVPRNQTGAGSFSPGGG